MPNAAARYDEDLAYVHAVGFSGLVTGAMSCVLPRLRADPTPVRRMYDVGCGSGVSTRALVDAGYEVVGLEPSPSLAAMARAAAPSAEVVEATIYGVELERCDAILAIGEPLTYHARDTDPRGRLQSFFAAAARALRPGGHLMFDLIETGTPSLTARGWAAGDDWAVLTATTEDVEQRRLERRIETFREVSGAYRRSRETHTVAVFDADWVVAALAAAGFDTVTDHAYGAHPLAVRRRAFFARRRSGTQGP
jgi:SAM-dependent methyltransferase